MGFDMGGPVNKTASMAANALGADGINGPMCAKIIGGMTPAIGVGLSALTAPKEALCQVPPKYIALQSQDGSLEPEVS